MRPFRPNASIIRAAIIIMAVGTLDHAGGGERHYQAGDIRVFTDRLQRMERSIRRVKLIPRIMFVKLAIDVVARGEVAIRVTTEAQLILICDLIDYRSLGINSPNLPERAGERTRRGIRGRVRAVAIHAFYMPAGSDYNRFRGIMHSGRSVDRMYIRLIELGKDILSCRVAIVAHHAVTFLRTGF